MTTRKICISKTVSIGGASGLVLIAGPCVIESEHSCLAIARRLTMIAEKLSLPLIFKASFDKANRSSWRSFRGPGLIEGLNVLKKVKRNYHLPVVSDVHDVSQVTRAARVLDLIQVPAFLCRQTDLLLAVARTGKPVAIKKGQFLAPWDIQHIIEKMAHAGNRDVMMIERGTSFGYNNLITDFRSLPIMRSRGCPVIFDATHSVQLPGGEGSESGGQRQFVDPLVRAACAVGCDGLFMEVHQDPTRAKCDGPNMVALDDLEPLLVTAKAIARLVPKEIVCQK